MLNRGLVQHHIAEDDLGAQVALTYIPPVSRTDMLGFFTQLVQGCGVDFEVERLGDHLAPSVDEISPAVLDVEVTLIYLCSCLM